MKTARKFVDDNGTVLAKDISNLAEVTNTLMQPDARNGIETALHVYPNMAANVNNIYHPTHGAIVVIPAIASWANPMQFICSAIQAGSRVEDSAELCAQYLAPILDATKFNYLPFGVNQFSGAETLPIRGLLRGAAAYTAGIQGHHGSRVSGRGTPCSRTATMSPAGSWPPVCRASR